MLDVMPELRSWTMMTSRYHLRQVISNLNIPDTELQQYIVLKTDTQSSVPNRQNEYIPEPVEVRGAIKC